VLHRDTGPMGWTPFHEALAAHHRVYAVDLPGFGESDRAEWVRHPRDLAAITLAAARRLGLRDYVVVGLGFGGWVALEMAAFAYPEMSRLVLASPAGIKPDEGDVLDQIMEDPVDYFRAGFSSQTAFESWVPDPSAPELKAQLARCRETIARTTWKPYMYSYELPETLREVRLPVTVAWGTGDKVIPSCVAHQLEALLPMCELHLVDGGPHFLELEQPGAISAIALASPEAVAAGR
jgi:pimeloyl-ACP methyl ester carboxylesterase